MQIDRGYGFPSRARYGYRGPGRYNPTQRRVFRQRNRANMSRKYARANRRANARIGGFLGIEVKFYDTSLSANGINAPVDASAGEQDQSATICCTTVTQGDGESQRDGKKISMRSIQVHGRVTCSQQATENTLDNSTKVFIALVLDRQSNGAQLNSEDVFINPSAAVTTASDPFRNLQYSKRFRVLARKKLTFALTAATNDTGAAGGVVQGGIERSFEFFKKLNIVANYSGTTETIANSVDNSIHLIAYCTSTALTPLLSYNARLRFVG